MRNVAVVMSSFLIASAVSANEPTLTVVWNDHYGAFPSQGLEMLGSELRQVFARYGVAVRLHVARTGENLRDVPAPRVQAIVTTVEGSRFRLDADAMAAAIGERNRSYSIFVFFPGVTRALGHSETDPLPRRLRELARATARVLAHELVHVLAPERPHTNGGLMSEKLLRRHLLTKRIDLDAVSVRLVKSKLSDWGEAQRGVVGGSPC